jgi:hypothetical protein
MSISDRKLAANRENAQHSHGPVTPEGKAISSQNATKHGLCGRFKVLAGENQAAFDELFNQFVKDEQPVGSVEVELVRRMAEYSWLRDRASRFQTACFHVADPTPELTNAGKADIGFSPELERFLRYQAHFDRGFSRASAELQKRRKERRLQEAGFVSQKRAEAEEQRKTELHPVKVRTANARAEAQEIRNGKAMSAFLAPDDAEVFAQMVSHAAASASAPPKTGQIAA